MTRFKISPSVNKLYTKLKLKSDNLADLFSTAAALGSIIYSDYIDHEQITPQMREAFYTSFPNKDISELSDFTAIQLEGVVNNWKGKYFEVLLRDELNAGNQVGNIILEDGQIAKLSENLTEPGWDLKILNSDGTIADEIQAKATDNIYYVKDALEKYDYDIITTSEISEFSEKVSASDFSDVDLEKGISSPIEALFDSSATNTLEEVVPSLPFVIIAISEGRKIIMRKESLSNGLKSSFSRSAKTGASMSAGLIAASIFGGFLAIPASIATRYSIDRFKHNKTIVEEMTETNKKLTLLERKYIF